MARGRPAWPAGRAGTVARIDDPHLALYRRTRAPDAPRGPRAHGKRPGGIILPMRRLLRWCFNGLCLLSLLACLAVAALSVRGRHTQDYFVAARPSGGWWLAGSGPGGFVLTAWRGEPRGSPTPVLLPRAAAPGAGPAAGRPPSPGPFPAVVPIRVPRRRRKVRRP